MKKVVSFCISIFMMLLFSVSAFAADSPAADSSTGKASTKITVSFKAGTGSYTVNGKTVKAEASAAVNGKTFVPVKVITDALNAVLTVDLKKKTAIINYNGVEIKLTEKKLDAVVGGKAIKADAAPYIKNSSFMATISFLADTLGADLTSKDGQITFIKEIANPNSIKDFGSLIKKTARDKIGDSYYNWSMMLPDDLKLEYRDFNGTENYFIAQDGSYEVSLYLYETDETSSLDNVENYMLEWTEDYTLIDYGRERMNGYDYVEFIYKDDEWTYQKRVFLTKEKEYEIIIYTQNDDAYLDDKYQDLINSLNFNFPKDKSAEDLSDVKSNGYRTYQDTRLKWSIEVFPYWEEIKDRNIQNSVNFYGKGNEYGEVSIYSLEKGETLDSVTRQLIKDDTDKLNPEFFKIVRQEDSKINGVSCKKIYYTLAAPDNTYSGCEAVLVDKNYKYIVDIQLPDTEYNKSSKKSMLEGMLSSFKFSELDPKVTGKLLDRNKISLSNSTKNIDEALYSFKIPFNWTESAANTEISKTYFSDNMEISINTLKDVKLPDVISIFDQQFKNLSGKDFEVVSKTWIDDKGTACCKYNIVNRQNNKEFVSMVNILQKGNNVIAVTFVCENIYLGPKNVDIINKIWESFTLK